MKRGSTQEVEECIHYLMGEIYRVQNGRDELEESVLYVQERINAAQAQLQRLQMYDVISSAVTESKRLTRQGDFDEACELLRITNLDLMTKTGCTFDPDTGRQSRKIK